MATFGDLRSALQGTPSEETWAAVCAVLDELKGKKLTEEIKTYLEDTLTHSWPDDVLRFAPREWVTLGSGNMKTPKRWHPNVVYCDALDLSDRGINNKRASALSDATQLAQIRHLDLSNNQISRSGFGDIFCSPHLGELRTIICSNNYFSKGTLKDIPDLGKHAPKLERFDFVGSYYEGLDGYVSELEVALKAIGVSGTISAY
jgi:hypothetical protein